MTRGKDLLRKVARMPRAQDRKNVRRYKATVVEVEGTPPSQKARFLMPGEAETERPFFPVRGSVSVGEGVFVEVNASGYVVVGTPAGGGPGGSPGLRYFRTNAVSGEIPGNNVRTLVPFSAPPARAEVGTHRHSDSSWTCAEAGNHLVGAMVLFTQVTDGTQLTLYLRTNDLQADDLVLDGSHSGSTRVLVVSGSVPVSLAAGDRLQVVVAYATPGAATTAPLLVNAASYFFVQS